MTFANEAVFDLLQMGQFSTPSLLFSGSKVLQFQSGTNFKYSFGRNYVTSVELFADGRINSIHSLF